MLAEAPSSRGRFRALSRLQSQEEERRVCRDLNWHMRWLVPVRENVGRLRLAASLLAAAALAAAAPDPAVHHSDDQLPLEPDRTIAFTTDRGTWMSLDVSPDGRTIVFDLLGDLHTVSIEGGRATRITSGLAFDSQPRYSPDG